MVEKDNYATTPYTSEGATGGNSMPNSYISDSPFGNVRVYDLDAQIPPIERMQIVPNVPNLASSIQPTTPTISEVSETTTTIAPIASEKDHLPLKLVVIYGVGFLAYYTLYKMLTK